MNVPSDINFGLASGHQSMSAEIDSINKILPTADAGYYNDDDDYDVGEKVVAIRRWITSLIRKIIRHKEEHQRLLNEAANTQMQW